MARAIGGVKTVYHQLAGAWIIQIGLDVVPARNFGALRNIQRAFGKHDSVGGVQAFQDGFDFALAVLIDNGNDIFAHAVADKNRAFVTQGHGACRRHAIGPHVNLETRGNFQLAQRNVLGLCTGHDGRKGMQRDRLRRVVNALLPGGRRRRACCGRRSRLGKRRHCARKRQSGYR